MPLLASTRASVPRHAVAVTSSTRAAAHDMRHRCCARHTLRMHVSAPASAPLCPAALPQLQRATASRALAALLAACLLRGVLTPSRAVAAEAIGSARDAWDK